MAEHKRPAVLLFDVNETLIDLSDVKEKVNKALGSKQAFKLWFGLLLQYAGVDTLTGNYHDFGSIAKATLPMAAQALETNITDAAINDILETLKNLPPHEDVKEGLTLLKEAGFRLATLTNSPPATLQQQLEKNDLMPYFSDTLSVDEFKLYKPHVEVYKKTLAKLGVAPGKAMMVAAHGWDIAGALAAGMQAAFIQRKEQALFPLAPEPRIKGKNLVEVARFILQG